METLPGETPVPNPNYDVLNCRNCSTGNEFKSKFCRSCGQALHFRNSAESVRRDNETLRQIVLFFIVLVLLLGIYGYTELFDPTFSSSLLMDGLLAVVITTFAIINRKELGRLYSFRNMKVLKAVLFCAIMVVFAIIVHLLAGVINNALYDDNFDGATVSVYSETAYPLLFSVLLTGVYPAVFEELAFRGFLFNYLMRFTNAKTTVIVTGVLFAFVHFAFIALIWHIPIGLFLGYLRIRYRTLWYSMLCHFIYNTTIVAIEFLA